MATAHVVSWGDTLFSTHVHRLQERHRSLMYSQEVSLLKSSMPRMKFTFYLSLMIPHAANLLCLKITCMTYTSKSNR